MFGLVALSGQTLAGRLLFRREIKILGITEANPGTAWLWVSKKATTMSKLLNFALAGATAARTPGRVFAGSDSSGLSIAGNFAGYDKSGNALYYGSSQNSAGLSIAGAKGPGNVPGTDPIWQQVRSDAANLGQMNAALQALQAQVSSLATPNQAQLEARMMAQRQAQAQVSDQGVLVHDQRGPKRHLLFPIGTNQNVAASGGTGTITAAPQKPFQPHRMIVAGASLSCSSGGVQGLLLTSLFVGADLQLVSIPGQSSGIPVEFFDKTAFDASFKFDASYPAIGISLGV